MLKLFHAEPILENRSSASRKVFIAITRRIFFSKYFIIAENVELFIAGYQIYVRQAFHSSTKNMCHGMNLAISAGRPC